MAETEKMKLGIALGGGGAKGFAHIGILQFFESRGIHFDVVTGTSIGSLVGAAYAADSLPALALRAEQLRLTDIPLLLSPTISKSGLFSGRSALELLGEIIPFRLIEELPRTFAAVSVDLATEELLVFSQGSISDAVRASISIPALFTPIKSDKRVLVDGGLLEPVPVALCRALGADVVVAIDLFGNRSFQTALPSVESNTLWPSGLASALQYLKSLSQRLKLSEWFGSEKEASQAGAMPNNIIEVIEATLALGQRQLTAARLKEHPADLLLQPPLREVGLLDFHRAKPVIEIGRQCAEDALEDVTSLIASAPR